MSFGDEVAERCWCTGALVPPGKVQAIAGHLAWPGRATVQVTDSDWLVVVSQTCDVLAAKLEAEPLVEVLHCRPIPKLRKGTKELRSTRSLVRSSACASVMRPLSIGVAVAVHGVEQA